MHEQPHAGNRTGTRPRKVTRYSQHHRPIAITISEACRLSGLGRSKIYQLIADGRLDSIVVDRRRLIRMHSLEHLLGA
jgi:excisionase family DNA binding protein